MQHKLNSGFSEDALLGRDSLAQGNEKFAEVGETRKVSRNLIDTSNDRQMKQLERKDKQCDANGNGNLAGDSANEIRGKMKEDRKDLKGSKTDEMNPNIITVDIPKKRKSRLEVKKISECKTSNTTKGKKKNAGKKNHKKKERIKGNWKKDEDILLMKLVLENGARNWSKIAEKFESRIGKQCRERWHNHLNPNINKKKWTEQEEAILLVTHEKFGNKWALISKYLPGRTDNCIKNHWNSTIKRKMRNNFFKTYPLDELRQHFFGLKQPKLVGQKRADFDKCDSLTGLSKAILLNKISHNSAKGMLDMSHNNSMRRPIRECQDRLKENYKLGNQKSRVDMGRPNIESNTFIKRQSVMEGNSPMTHLFGDIFARIVGQMNELQSMEFQAMLLSLSRSAESLNKIITNVYRDMAAKSTLRRPSFEYSTQNKRSQSVMENLGLLFKLMNPDSLQSISLLLKNMIQKAVSDESNSYNDKHAKELLFPSPLTIAHQNSNLNVNLVNAHLATGMIPQQTQIHQSMIVTNPDNLMNHSLTKQSLQQVVMPVIPENSHKGSFRLNDGIIYDNNAQLSQIRTSLLPEKPQENLYYMAYAKKKSKGPNSNKSKILDDEMKRALDIKIQTMEKEKDRSYQLQRLMETIHSSRSPEQKSKRQISRSRILENKLEHDKNGFSTPMLGFPSLHNKENYRDQKTHNNNNNVMYQRRRGSLYEEYIPQPVSISLEDSDLRKKVQYSSNMIPSQSHHWFGNFLNNFQSANFYQNKPNPKIKIQDERQNLFRKDVSNFLDNPQKPSLGFSYVNETPTRSILPKPEKWTKVDPRKLDPQISVNLSKRFEKIFKRKVINPSKISLNESPISIIKPDTTTATAKNNRSIPQPFGSPSNENQGIKIEGANQDGRVNPRNKIWNVIQSNKIDSFMSKSSEEQIITKTDPSMLVERNSLKFPNSDTSIKVETKNSVNAKSEVCKDHIDFILSVDFLRQNLHSSNQSFPNEISSQFHNLNSEIINNSQLSKKSIKIENSIATIAHNKNASLENSKVTNKIGIVNKKNNSPFLAPLKFEKKSTPKFSKDNLFTPNLKTPIGDLINLINSSSSDLQPETISTFNLSGKPKNESAKYLCKVDKENPLSIKLKKGFKDFPGSTQAQIGSKFKLQEKNPNLKEVQISDFSVNLNSLRELRASKAAQSQGRIDLSKNFPALKNIISIKTKKENIVNMKLPYKSIRENKKTASERLLDFNLNSSANKVSNSKISFNLLSKFKNPKETQLNLESAYNYSEKALNKLAPTIGEIGLPLNLLKMSSKTLLNSKNSLVFPKTIGKLKRRKVGGEGVVGDQKVDLLINQELSSWLGKIRD